MLVSRYSAVAVSITALLLLSGCGDSSTHSTWKSTRGLYYEYLNPPASIDYDDVGNINKSETLLARNMRPIDTELTRLERYMMNQDKPQTLNQVNALFERFRWVGGVTAISAEGELVAQQPEGNIKQLDFTSLLAVDGLTPRDLRADVQETPFGPEVLLGIPLFENTELKALFISHFDIRLLLEGVPDPGNLVITSRKGVLWPGVFGSTPLDGQDWEAILKSSIRGKISNEQGTFFWMVRYYGGLPLIFGTPASENTFATNPAQLDKLRELGIAVPEPAPTVSEAESAEVE